MAQPNRRQLKLISDLQYELASRQSPFFDSPTSRKFFRGVTRKEKKGAQAKDAVCEWFENRGRIDAVFYMWRQFNKNWGVWLWTGKVMCRPGSTKGIQWLNQITQQNSDLS